MLSNGHVNGLDAQLINQRVGTTAGGGGYTIFRDIDGAGVISTSEVQEAEALAGTYLPAGTPVGAADNAPTTAGIPDVGVATGTTDYVLSLPNFFQSDETASTNLAYSIVNNTNPSAFNSLTIDSQGNLTMQFASNASGNATLTVRATDAAGLLVDATVTVHVNEPPVIGDFWAQEGTMDYWTLSGDVSDNGAPVAGNVVTFGGVLAGFNVTATVRADGTFVVCQSLPGLQEGIGTAQTQDPFGIPSNQASVLINPTT